MHNYYLATRVLFACILVFVSQVQGNLICDNLQSSGDISRDPNEVKFYLYSNPLNVNEFEELQFQDLESVENSRFDSSKSVIVLIHGFIQNYTTGDFPGVIKNAYLNNGYATSSNIVVVDWGALAGANASEVPIPIVSTIQQLPLYLCAVENVPTVGQRVGEFLKFLVDNKKTTESRVHIVGQSLGSHVAGVAGKTFQSLNKSSLQRITGTDPASPLFFGNPTNAANTLNKQDATFVDIVHVNQGEFGYPVPLGDVDFYVNGGGPLQPQCGLNEITNFFCAHNSAPYYYAKSIGTNALVAKSCPLEIPLFPCKSIIFGENCPSNFTGRYYINISI